MGRVLGRLENIRNFGRKPSAHKTSFSIILSEIRQGRFLGRDATINNLQVPSEMLKMVSTFYSHTEELQVDAGDSEPPVALAMLRERK